MHNRCLLHIFFLLTYDKPIRDEIRKHYSHQEIRFYHHKVAFTRFLHSGLQIVHCHPLSVVFQHVSLHVMSQFGNRMVRHNLSCVRVRDTGRH